MPAKITFTDAEILAFVARYEAGESCRLLAEERGVAKNTIRQALLGAGVEMDRKRSQSNSATGRPSPRRGAVMTPETRQRMSQARKGVPGKKGHRFTPESRALMRDTRLRLMRDHPELLEKLREGAAAIPRLAPEERTRRNVQRSAYKRLIRRLLTGKKPGRSVEMLGYTRDQFVAHIESQFTPGMSWGPEMHIDHLVPVSAFFAHGITDPRIVNALCNLRPLTAAANRAKSDRYPAEQFQGDLARILATI